MKLIRNILLIAYILIAGNAWGATYYVGQSAAGTADGSSVANCSAIATFNAGTAPYDVLDDDTVYLLDSITAAVVIPDGGTSGHIATIRGDYAGHACTISGNLTPIVTIAKDYVTIAGFSLTYNTGTDVNSSGVSIIGIRTDVTVSNIAINKGGYGYGLLASGNNTNLALSGITVTNNSKFSVYLYGASSSAVTLANITTSAGSGISIANVAGLTMSTITANYSTAGARGMILTSCSGAFSLNGFTVTSVPYYGLRILTSNFTAGSSISNFTITTSGFTGIEISESSNVAFSTGTITAATGAGINIIGSNTLSFANVTVSGTVTGYGAGWLFSDAATASYGVTWTDCIADSNALYGWRTLKSEYNLTWTRCTASNNGGTGWNITGMAEGVGGGTHLYTQCVASTNGGDGFSVDYNVHDVTYNRCVAHHNGTKTSTSEGDGYTCHRTNYNLIYNYCVAHNNTASGWALYGTSSGFVYNCVAYNNAGNWSTEGGGIDQTRGGLQLSLSGVNPTSGLSWVVRNFIGYSNYKCEVWISTSGASLVDLDYNLYLEEETSRFATIDSASSFINWDTYASREPHSINSDPLFVSSSDFQLQSTSLGRDIGEDLCATLVNATDMAGLIICFGGAFAGKGLAPDIGAYEYSGGNTSMIGVYNAKGMAGVYNAKGMIGNVSN